MKKHLPATGPRCPECGQGQLIALTRTEQFDFDLGDETVKVRAENVPVQQCDKCGEVISGHMTARSDLPRRRVADARRNQGHS
jgi:YgiT-type zinc finger domain-containing protein